MERTGLGVKSALRQPHLVLLPAKKLRLAPYLAQKPQAETLADLTDNIRRLGLLSPLGVRRLKGGGRRYEVLYGARRYAACLALGIKKIPCILYPKTAPGLLIALSENLIRRESAEETLKLHAARTELSPAALCRRYALPLPQSLQSEQKLQGICLFDEPAAEPFHSAPVRKGVFRDVRLITNSIDRALELGKHAGFDVEAQKIERGREICYHIRLPRAPEVSDPPTFPRAG